MEEILFRKEIFELKLIRILFFSLSVSHSLSFFPSRRYVYALVALALDFS
jgi:hypothetical protein